MDQLQHNIQILKEKKFEVNDPLLLFDAIENDINEQFNFLNAQEKQLAVQKKEFREYNSRLLVLKQV